MFIKKGPKYLFVSRSLNGTIVVSPWRIKGEIMSSVIEEIFKIGLVPVAKLQADQAVAVAEVLEQAGVPCIALKNPTPDVVAALKKRPNFLVGEYVPAELKDLAAGIEFVAEENFSPKLQTSEKENNVPFVNLQNLPGGPFMLEDNLTGQSDWQNNLLLRLQKAIRDMLAFDLRHVGINCQDETQSSNVAEAFQQIFGFPKEDRGGAYFAGEIIEVMKKPFYGTHGHIAIATNYAVSAAYHLEKAGVKLNWKSAGYDPDGRLRVVYLQDEIGGFAVHILQR